ncbi:MAG: PAS domain-containing protein [Rhodobacteraceae bacterium]|nr:MAG: PAS domain-containing protein [Paracoccaceae bacterium]
MTDDDDQADNGTVVSIATDQAVRRCAALTRIEAYWSELRAGRLVPSRSEIDPRGMEGVLAHAFILERLATGLARLRIAGSHMTEILGLEARGLPLSAVFEGDSRETLADALEACFNEPALIRLSLLSDRGFGRPELIGGMVLLPMRSDLGDITRVLGGISLNGSVGRTPRRLRITGQSRTSLVGYAGPRGQTTGLSGRFAVPGRPAPVTKDSDRPRSDHLRLVVVNEA